MSRTDKTTPMWVQEKYPETRKFRRVTNDNDYFQFWKKLDSCHRGSCCYGLWSFYEKRKRRAHIRLSMRNALKTTPQHRNEIDVF